MPLVTHRTITELHTDKPYLLRWSLWLPFGYSIKLHEILRADEDRCEHDHPFWMLRIILWGGYTEVRDKKAYLIKPWRPWAPWRLYLIRGEFKHRILSLNKGKSYTLAICGRNTGKWGFYTKTGWVDWRKFVDHAHAKRVLWCDDGRDVTNAS